MLTAQNNTELAKNVINIVKKKKVNIVKSGIYSPENFKKLHTHVSKSVYNTLAVVDLF